MMGVGGGLGMEATNCGALLRELQVLSFSPSWFFSCTKSNLLIRFQVSAPGS
jgi:hypothetical protein